METAVLWKAAMKPRLPTGLGKRRHEPAAVSHSSHSPRHQKKRANQKSGDRTPKSVKDVAVDLSGKSPRVQTLSPLRGARGNKRAPSPRVSGEKVAEGRMRGTRHRTAITTARDWHHQLNYFRPRS